MGSNRLSSHVVWIVIIILIILIYINVGRNYSAEALLATSAGVMDPPAIAAMGALREAKRPRDLVTRAEIRNLNWIGAMSAEDIAANEIEVARAIDASLRDWRQSLQLLAAGADDENPIELVHRIDNFNPIMFHADEFEAFREVYDTTVPEIYRRDIERRRDTVTADNHLEGTQQMLASGTAVRSDPQNVHDSTVNASLRGTLLKIRKNVDPAREISSARKYVQKVMDAERRGRALRALDAITSDHIYTFGDTEANIFAYVWSRATDPGNARSTDNIREAIVDALASSIEGETTVCINGRASRVLSALTLLDHDKSVAEPPKTLDIYRQQIFGELAKLVESETERVASGHGDLAASAQKYRGDDIPADDRPFTEHLDTKIEEHIRGYGDQLAPNDIERLVAECKAVL